MFPRTYPFDDRFLLHLVMSPFNPLGVLAPTFEWVLVGIAMGSGVLGALVRLLSI